MKKRVLISVTNDLATDQRVKKVCGSLNELGYDILLIGRKLPDSLPLNRSYATFRMRLVFNKGPLFYAEYNIRLFLLLLFSKATVFHANDLDTILANFIASKIRGIPLVYDSHEYFTGVPEIQNKPLVKAIWLSIERWIFPKLNDVFTVNKSIAKLYKNDYNKDLRILRNIPHKITISSYKTREELQLPENQNIVITQGAGINIDRGIEEAVEAMQYLPNVCLLIIGNGDVIPQLKKRTVELNLEKNVIFKGRMPYEEMMQHTHHAALGLTLDKDTNINYKFSLPNKLFDYIHAGIPVLASKVIEVENIINSYNVGLFIDNHTPKHIAAQIRKALEDESLREKWKLNSTRAKNELHWKNEEKELIEVYAHIES
mgnify:CR=1 FL=1